MFRLAVISLLLFVKLLVFSSGSQTMNAEIEADSLAHSGKNSIDIFKDFFDKDEALHLSLEFDMKSFQRTKAREKYHSALLNCNVNDSSLQSYTVRLKTRGTFRKSFCSVPPFWLNINNSGIVSDALSEVSKMKIVTHCMNTESYKDYLLKEYLVYKMYSFVSPYSFRVRLLRITLIDTGRKNKQTEVWGFAIEPKELMASRLNASIVEHEKLSIRNMNSTVMDKLALFNYMIGNTDYSIPGMHNVKLFMLNDPAEPGIIPIPYDFDFTGFVDAAYAIPADNTGITEVTSRYYTGLCRSDDIFKSLVADYNQHIKEFLSLLQPFELVSPKQKSEMIRYIESYFDEASADSFIERILRRSCQ